MSDIICSDAPDTYVRRMLDINTTHLSREACEWLDEHATATGEHGWLVGVRDEEEENIPPSLHAVFAVAAKLDCLWVLLDNDANEHPDLAQWCDEDGARRETVGPVREATGDAEAVP